MSAASSLECPSCGRVWWPNTDEVLGHRCPACGGLHLPAHAVEQVLLEERGWSIAELRAAAERGRNAADDDVRACAACRGPLSPVDVDGSAADLCARCGSVWLDVGELEALSFGRHREREEPDEAARRFLPKKAKRVFVPAHRTAGQRVSAVITTVVGIAAIPAFLIGVPIVAYGLRGRSAFVVDRERERVGVRFGTSDRDWVPFGSGTHIDVVPVAFTKAGKPGGYQVRFHTAAREQPLVLFVRDRVQAHRYAFQLSQLTGMRVEMETEHAAA